MPWIQLTFNAPLKMAERISNFLHDNGALSVTLLEGGEDEIFEPLPGETPLWQHTRVVGLFEADANIEKIIGKLKRSLKPNALPAYETQQLEDEVWERAWLKDFKPTQFGARTWIIPSVYELVDPSAVNIRLDPGLAFGTGTHPTTAMCVEWIDQHGAERANVLDFGCGSGILAIVAAKHGAEHIWAVDIDPQALIATVDNARMNEVDHLISAELSPNFRAPVECDLLLANILANPLVELAAYLTENVKIGGKIILSGILSEQKTHVQDAYQSTVDFNETKEVNGWVMLAGTRVR